MFAVQIISSLQWFSRCSLTPKIILLHWNMSFSQFFLCGKMFLSDQIDWMSGKTLSLAWHKTGLQKKIICRLEGCYYGKEMNSPYSIRRNCILNALQHCLSCDLVWLETISNMKWVIGYGHSLACLLHEGIYMWVQREIWSACLSSVCLFNCLSVCTPVP